MRKPSLNTNGFGLIGVLIVVAAIVMVGGSGAYMYHLGHKAKTNTTHSASNVTGKIATSSPSGTTKPNSQSDPYAGWLTSTLKYEQATFKYPSSWQLSNISKDESGTGGTVIPGSDEAILTSPTGLAVRIDTGVAGFNEVTPTALSTQSINTLGGSYKLDFYTNDSSNTSAAQAACVTSDDTPGTGFGSISSKHITMTGTNASVANDTICVEYPDSRGDLSAKSVSAFQQDASYTDAELIIESLSY